MATQHASQLYYLLNQKVNHLHFKQSLSKSVKGLSEVIAVDVQFLKRADKW